MAGDWIKMRSDLFTHPKVVLMASALKADKSPALKADRLRTVGGLMSVWCLFDAHSIDGRLAGYSFEAIDEHVGVAGFARAMAGIEWLMTTDEGLVLPDFDTHNGQSAKRRAQDADRKREDRKMSGSKADKMRTREEKSREEKKEQDQEQMPPTASAPTAPDLGSNDGGAKEKPPKRNGTRLPDDWKPAPELIDAARAERPDIDLRLETAKFRDFWRAKTGRDATKLDWDATYRNWIRNARSSNGFGQRNEPVRHREELRR